MLIAVILYGPEGVFRPIDAIRWAAVSIWCLQVFSNLAGLPDSKGRIYRCSQW
jgi:hypothetical protein